MKYVITILMSLPLLTSWAQGTEKTEETEKTEISEYDTTRFKLGPATEMILIQRKNYEVIDNGTTKDTIDAAPDHSDDPSHKGHWGGIDFGPSILLNSSMQSSFPDNPQWENDPARSFYWNINFMDRRLNIYKHYVGITTGLGINFTQIGFRNNEVLYDSPDSLYFVKDTVNVYAKNKLRGTYLQVPVLLEFNTNNDESKSFYFAAGLIGGVRVGSALIQKIERDGTKNKDKIKGAYGLNPFKVDATMRLGYGKLGLFANYALMPLLDTQKTSEIYPVTFGATWNF